MRWLLIGFFFALGSLARSSPAANTAPSPFNPEIATLSSPAGAGAMGSSLITGANGTVYLSWVEPVGTDGHALKFSALESAARRWSAPLTIAQGKDWFINWADFPALAAEKNGRLTAVWYVNNPAPVETTAHADHAAGHDHSGPGYHAVISQSTDAGAHWSNAQPLSRESNSVEFVSLQPLADGAVLAAWLDGRGKRAGGKAEQLYSRVIGSSGPDLLVDPSTCDCCQTTLTAFPDGSALLAYRGRADGEIRDILTARFDRGQWQTKLTSSRDNWQINGCPVNGPQLSSSGPRVSLAWFTAAGNEPRVLVGMSPNAGDLYTMAQRADLGHPTGRVDVILLRDGSQLVSWLEDKGADDSQPAGIYLRRYAPSGSTLTPALLAPATSTRASGFPRMALVKDFDDQSAAQIVVSYTQADEPTRVQTLLLTLPDAAVLNAADNACECGGKADTAAGYPIRGKIASLSAARGTLHLAHPAVPGLLRAGEDEFKLAPDVLAAVTSGREILARIEERSDGWWIFEVRLLPAK
jgi:hypothetical protein